MLDNECDELLSKRIRIDSADLESSDDIDSFAQHYEELCKILPNVTKILHSQDQLDILLQFFMLIVDNNFNFENVCNLQFVSLINFLSFIGLR